MTLFRGRIGVSMLAVCAPLLLFVPSAAAAQTENDAKNTQPRTGPEVSETVFLSNVTGSHDMNDIQTALRNNFIHAQTYGVADQLAITLHGTPEDVQGMKKMIAELDRPKKIYRVTYSVSDVENGKRTATQRYSLVVAAGGKTLLREGNRVPLITGMSGESANPSQSSQVQYIDVGLNIDASIEGAALRTKIEQSSVTDQKSAVVAPDPIIHQTMLEGMSALAAGKPVVLGSLDVPGSTRREEIEVIAEAVAQ